MKANLLYIQEDGINYEFRNKLCLLSKMNMPLVVVVQLKFAPHDSQPLINNLKEIRIQKAKKRIEDWINICTIPDYPFSLVFIDGKPTLSKLKLNLSGITEVTVHSSSEKDAEITYLLKKHLGSRKINLHYSEE